MLQNYRLETSIENFKYFTAMATLSNSTINVITLEASKNKQWSTSVHEVFFEPCDMKTTVKDQRIDINYHKPLGRNISSGSHIFITLQRILMKLYIFTKISMIKWSAEFVLFQWKVRKLVDILPACVLVLANDKTWVLHHGKFESGGQRVFVDSNNCETKNNIISLWE